MLIRTMRGEKLDMSMLKAQNSHKVALGNAGMNARGDKIAPGGQVVTTREQVMTDYNVANPKAVRQVGLNNIRQEALSPADAAALVRKQQQQDAKAAGVDPNRPRRKITESDI